MSQSLPISIVCTPGFEYITRAELRGLSVAEVSPPEGIAEPGLLFARVDHATLYALNLHLRTAARVRINTEPFLAAAFSELRKKAARLPWSAYLAPGAPVRIKVTTHGSALYHKKGIAERVAGAIADALGKPSPLAEPGDEDDAGALQVFVRIVRNRCAITIDSSGAHLHRRGYRLQTAKAPLRETLAASLVLASGWDAATALADPFCGSGTIVIEAALIAAGIPPGAARRFAFMEWPSFDAAAWRTVTAAVPPPRRPGLPPLLGSDRDAGAIAAAEANAARAGVGDLIRFTRQSISDFTAPAPSGWIITNPPYGERVRGGPDLRNLYARMGSVWQTLGPMWHTYLVTSSPRWAGHLGMPVARVASFLNGGLPVTFYRAGGAVEPS